MSEVYVKSFGAVGDGVTDDTEALQAAIDATPVNGALLLEAGATYKTSKDLVGVKNIHFLGKGATIVATHHKGRGLVFEGSLKATTTTSAAYTANTTYVTVGSTSGMAVGDQIRIYHTGDLYDTSRAYYYKGGNFLITKISGNNVYISRRIPYDMKSGAKVEVYKPITVTVDDLTIKHTGTLGSSVYGEYGLNIRFSKYSEVSNVTVDNFNHNIKMDMTLNCLLYRVKTGKAYWSGSSESYGVSNYSGNGLMIMHSTLNSGRHGYTTTGQETSYDTVLNRCTIGQDDAVDLAGLDCHGNNYSLRALECTIKRFHLAGNCLLERCTVNESAKGNSSSFMVAETRPRSNFFLKDCYLYSPVYKIDAWGQQPTTSRKYIGSIVFENVKGGDAYTQCTFKSRDTGGSVQAIIDKLIVRGCENFTLVTNEQINNMYFEEVNTKRDAKILEQVGDAKADKIEFKKCTLPARWRTFYLTNFKNLKLIDCKWNVINSSAASMWVTSSAASVDLIRTDFTFGGGVETGGLDKFTTTQTSSIKFKQPSSIKTKRRVTYTNI